MKNCEALGGPDALKARMPLPPQAGSYGGTMTDECPGDGVGGVGAPLPLWGEHPMAPFLNVG